MKFCVCFELLQFICMQQLVRLRQNLIANLFEKGESPCTKEFPDVKFNDYFLITNSKVYVVSHHNMESTE